MSTAIIVQASPPDGTESDLYRYGWRYIKHPQPDGTTQFEQVPLTLHDVLHPEEEDFILQSALHDRLCAYFVNVVRARVAQDPTTVVLSDCRIAWDVPDVEPLGPDVALIFGVHEQRNWSTFDVAVEGVRPALVIEVTKASTRQLDLYEKIDLYDLAGVPLYVVVDVVQRRNQAIPRLLGYQQTPTTYIPMIPNEQGWLWLEPIGLWLGAHDGQVACFDQDGALIGDYVQVDAARIEAEARVEAEVRARVEAEARAKIAEARAEIAEARLRDLEAELRHLQSGGAGQ